MTLIIYVQSNQVFCHRKYGFAKLSKSFDFIHKIASDSKDPNFFLKSVNYSNESTQSTIFSGSLKVNLQILLAITEAVIITSNYVLNFAARNEPLLTKTKNLCL